MPSFGFLKNKFFGNAASAAAGVAAGESAAAVLTPTLQGAINETWGSAPVRPPDADTMAGAAAQGKLTAASIGRILPGTSKVPKELPQDPVSVAKFWAKQSGFGDAQMTAMIEAAQSGPPLGQAIEAYRRNTITVDQYHLALHNAGIPQTWWKPLTDLAHEKLDPADLARGIHKGLIPDPHLLAVPAPRGVGNVPAYPIYDIDAIAEALANGIDKERLGVLVGLQGNPMGAHEAAQAFFRGVLKKVDFDRAIAEGNTRNEWGDAILAQSRQIPTARDFVENALRGYRTLPDAIEGAAKHGMSAADATLIYQNQGRPMNIRQITEGLARGAKFNPEPGEIKDPYMASIVEGSLKPGYYELEQTLKHVYPGFFQTLQALTKGWIDAATAEQWLLYQAYEPGAVKAIVGNVAGGGKATTSTWVTKARGYLFTKLHKEYQDTPEFDTYARQAMDLLGVTKADQETVLTIFKFEQGSGPQPAAKNLTPTSASVGGTVTVDVSGFSPNTAVTVMLGSTPAQPVSGQKTDGNGNATVRFTVPAGITGLQAVLVSDGSHTASPTGFLTVT